MTIRQGAVIALTSTIISYGEERPLCAEKTEECWAQNRQAHFLVKAQEVAKVSAQRRVRPFWDMPMPIGSALEARG